MTLAIERKPAPWLRPLLDLAPALVFLVVLLASGDFRKAAWALLGLSIASLAAGLVVERRIAPIPAFSCGMAVLFTSLALVLHRNDLLQMKMSIVDGLLGAVLFGGLLTKRNPLKQVMGHALDLPEQAWRVLMFRYGLFFWACALANEFVRRTQTAEVWASFRVGAIVASIAFGAAQIPFLKRHALSDEAAEPAPPEESF